MSREDRPTDLIGVIDIGSNSVRLLGARAASGRAEVVFTDMITSRLLSRAENGVLNEESILRTAEAIKNLIAEARERGAEKILAFGTCAMREGVNSGLILDDIRAATGVDIEILSGEDEAKVAYIGVSKSGKNGIIDIGGGSTEFTVGEDADVLACASANIGAVRLYEAAKSPERQALVARAREALAPAWKKVASRNAREWTGVGGTITTLAAMTLKLPVYDAKLVTGFELTYEETLGWLRALLSMTVEKRKNLPGLKANRADIIPFGAAILTAFFELSGAKFVTAADNDNMLGYLKLRNGLA